MVRDALAALAVALLLCAAVPARGYSWRPLGVESNMLVHDGTVCFAQGDDSLTVLDIATGRVLRRLQLPENFSPDRLILDSGCLACVSYSDFLVLDHQTSAVLWMDNARYAAVTSGVAVLAGEFGLSGRDLRTGQRKWSRVQPNVMLLAATSGRILVGSGDYGGGYSLVALLDAASGRELFSRRKAADLFIGGAFLDDEVVHVCVQTTESGAPVPHLEEWDSSGTMIRRLPCTARLCGQSGNFVRTRHEGDRAYQRDGYMWHEGAEPDFADQQMFFDINDGTTQSLAVGSLTLTGHARVTTITQDHVALLRFEGAGTSWTGYLPNIGSGGHIRVVRAGDDLLIGTPEAQVECVDWRSGRSRWMYVFPVIRGTLSYSYPFGLPPAAARAAQTQRLLIANMTRAAAMVVVPPEWTPPSARLQEIRALRRSHRVPMIKDPQVGDPTAWLRERLIIGWSWVAGAGALLLLYAAVAARLRLDVRINATAGALLAVMTSQVTLRHYLASEQVFIAARSLAALAILYGAFHAVRALRARHWFWAAGALALLAWATWTAFPEVMLFWIRSRVWLEYQLFHT